MAWMRRLWIVLWLLGLGRAWAGGAIQTDIEGYPLRWGLDRPLVFNVEHGALNNDPARGASYDVQASFQLLHDAFEEWAQDGTPLSIQQGDLLEDKGFPDGVDAGNFKQFVEQGHDDCYAEVLGGDPEKCLSPIVFDQDGAILESLFGECAQFSILGFAGFDEIDDGSGDPLRRIIRRGRALFSGACLPSPVTREGCAPCQRTLSDAEIRMILTHEVGHLLGMDHAQVNPQVFESCIASESGCSPDLVPGIPMMFPILVRGVERTTLHRDDSATFERLYGDPQARYCQVSGTVYASDAKTELRGVEVAAHNTNPELATIDAISFVSGAESPRVEAFNSSQGNCRADCGFYRITGLLPGQSYQLCVQRLNPQFTGGSSVEPVDPPFQKFSDECPVEAVVTCECEEGQRCPEIAGGHLITDANPEDIEPPLQLPMVPQQVDSASSGGCSLRKSFPPTGLWVGLRNSWPSRKAP